MLWYIPVSFAFLVAISLPLVQYYSYISDSVDVPVFIILQQYTLFHVLTSLIVYVRPCSFLPTLDFFLEYFLHITRVVDCYHAIHYLLITHEASAVIATRLTYKAIVRPLKWSIAAWRMSTESPRPHCSRLQHSSTLPYTP